MEYGAMLTWQSPNLERNGLEHLYANVPLPGTDQFDRFCTIKDPFKGIYQTVEVSGGIKRWDPQAAPSVSRPTVQLHHPPVPLMSPSSLMDDDWPLRRWGPARRGSVQQRVHHEVLRSPVGVVPLPGSHRPRRPLRQAPATAKREVALEQVEALQDHAEELVD